MRLTIEGTTYGQCRRVVWQDGALSGDTLVIATAELLVARQQRVRATALGPCWPADLRTPAEALVTLATALQRLMASEGSWRSGERRIEIGGDVSALPELVALPTDGSSRQRRHPFEPAARLANRRPAASVASQPNWINLPPLRLAFPSES